MERGKNSVFALLFLADQKIASSWGKKRFGASYSTSNKLLQQVIACCQTHSDYGPPKMSLKLAV